MPELKEILFFALPCGLVNMALNLIYVVKHNFPVLAQFDIPLDGEKNWSDGHRILGNSTTWPGLIVAIACGILISIIFPFTLEIGIIIGLCVYFGHALGSFIKRRKGYADGHYMAFVDHGDYIITTGIILGLLHQFMWITIIAGVAAIYIIHPIVTYLAYLLKLHKYPS